MWYVPAVYTLPASPPSFSFFPHRKLNPPGGGGGGSQFFFPSLFAGPAFDFVDYQRWLDTSMFDAPANAPGARPPTRPQRRIPRSGRPAAFKAAQGLVWIGVFLRFSDLYPAELLTGAAFPRFSLARRLWLLHMFGVTTRTKYYGVWALTEGACILSGLGYNGMTTTTGPKISSRATGMSCATSTRTVGSTKKPSP